MSNDMPSTTWESLEAFARTKIQQFIQLLLEEEVAALLGRGRSERRAAVDATAGYRNGFGKPRKLAMQGGTITLRRPRVRGLEERFASKVLPLFTRRTAEVGKMLPERARWRTPRAVPRPSACAGSSPIASPPSLRPSRAWRRTGRRSPRSSTFRGSTGSTCGPRMSWRVPSPRCASGTNAAKRFKNVSNANVLVWKVLRVAESRWRRLDAPELLKDVYEGRRFADGRPITRAVGMEAA